MSAPLLLSACGQKNIEGIIVPHHLLVSKFIDETYSKVSQNLPDTENIILISLNHFNSGFSYIQKPKLSEISDHGITAQIPFIEKYFPKAKIFPVIIKAVAPQNRLDLLITKLSELDPQKTLVIASIDFSHYIDEDLALKKDTATIDWLKSVKTKTDSEISLDEIKKLAQVEEKFEEDFYKIETPVAIDSPESLYVITKLMALQSASNFELQNRTSSASLLGIEDQTQNTSHIFGFFYK